MTIMTRGEEQMLQRLVAFAGDPVILEDALAQLRDELTAPPTLDELLRKIVKLREERNLGIPELNAVAG